MQFSDHQMYLTDMEFFAMWYEARRTHAFLLRLEGYGYREIAEKLGVSRERARQMDAKARRKFAKSLNRSMFIRWMTNMVSIKSGCGSVW